MRDPYFYIRQEAGRNVVSGTHSCILGNKLNAPLIKGRPQGIFAEWLWNGSSLKVMNDIYGFYPLYYYWDRKEFCVSPSLTKILEMTSDRSLDHAALSVFLRLGFFIGEDTPFQCIRALPPQASLRWENGEVVVEGHYTIPQAVSDKSEVAMDRLIALFREGLQYQMPQGVPFALTLSGGCDSRHVLFELLRSGERPAFCVTTRKYPPSTDDDMQLAKRIAKEVDIPHVVIEDKAPRFTNELRNFEKTNFCADEHAWILETALYLRDKVSVLYDGIGGGTFLMSHPGEAECAALIKAGNWDAAAEKLLAYWYKRDEKTFQLTLGQNFYRKVDLSQAKEHLIKELKKLAGAANPFVSFNFWNRSRREISLSPHAVFGHIPKVFCPLLYFPFVQYALSLPVEILEEKAFRQKFVQRANPQYAHIPIDNDDANSPQTAAHRGRFIADLAWYFLHGNFMQSKYLKMDYLLPRLFKCLFDRGYANSLWWIHPQVILYLVELEKLQRRSYIKTAPEKDLRMAGELNP